jgi:hypothetical protein
MVIVGLLLIALAAAATVAAVFATEGNDVTYLGFDVAPLTLFLIGVGTVLALALGLRLSRFGVKRGLRRRKEDRRLTKEADARARERAEESRGPEER